MHACTHMHKHTYTLKNTHVCVHTHTCIHPCTHAHYASTQYMDQEGTTTILLFWMAVESFHSSMNKPHSGDTEEDTEAAIAIYTRFKIM